MAILRRRRVDPELVDPTELTTALGQTFAEDLQVLDARVAAVDARLGAVEARVAAAEGAADLLPEHSDVLDVQLRAAKLAADLHMVSLELDRLRADAAAGGSAQG